ncbi:hypothetical protein QR680_014750 [Steinernema hermaphroditum]|uniref:G-protein coupled receptors family 1 profile domain-containing protein n=1 Tax=Steinernema hermaphroditum TaxID=289476 RepID=A0AA39M4T1_9BILA|nr:hypothetical protein QR680_014750 [Steinernema hermaphroditum]
MAIVDWRISQEALLTFGQYLVPVYMIFLPFCFVLNGLIIAVTIRSSRLRSNCNILIACQAFTDICTLSSLIYTCFNIYSNRFVSYAECFLYQIIPLAGGNCTSVLMLLIGIDRYLSVVHPGWYFSFHIIICSIYCVSVNVAQYMAQTYEPSVICFLPSAMPDRIKDWWSASQGFLSVMVIAVYVRMHRFLKSRPTQCDVEARRTIRALTMIVKVYLFGWATSIGLLCFSRILISDTNLAQAAELGLGVFAGLNLAIPCAVYYTQSNIYRKELRSLLRLKIEVSDIRTVSRHTS